MSKPTIRSMRLVAFKKGIDGCAMEKIVRKFSPHHVVEGAHISCVSGLIVIIILTMNIC